MTHRAKVTHRVILSLCQSDTPCHFVAVPKCPPVPKCRTVSIWRPCHFVAVPFWPAPSCIASIHSCMWNTCNTWRNVTDEWNWFNSVSLWPEDHHLKTTLTQWERYYYKVVPKGYLATKEAYTRKYDKIITDIPRKTKFVDDTVLWDEKLADNWWRMIDYLDLMGKMELYSDLKIQVWTKINWLCWI